MSLPLILYDNRFRDATPTATHTATGYNVASIADYRAYTAWQGNNNANVDLVVNCGSARAANAVGLITHNLNSIGSNVSVKYSNNGVAYNTASAAAIPSANNAFVRTFNNQAGQYWCVSCYNQNAAPSIGELFVGSALEFPFPPDRPFAPYTARIEADSALGKTGHLLGSCLKYTGISITAQWSNLPRTFVHNEFWTFWNTHARLLRPFFWAWDLNNFPAHVFYVTVKPGSEWQAPLSVGGYVDSVKLDMVGVMEV